MPATPSSSLTAQPRPMPRVSEPWAHPATPFYLELQEPTAATADAYARAAGLDTLLARTAHAAAHTTRVQPAAPSMARAHTHTTPAATVWSRLKNTCGAALVGSCATPARAALTAGSALLASMALAPGLGLTGTLMTLQTIAPYCAAAAAAQWLLHTPEAAVAARRQRRLALTAIGLPVGAALGCALGVVAGATGIPLLWAGAGGAAACLGALWLISEVFESRLGVAILALGLLLAVGRGVVGAGF